MDFLGSYFPFSPSAQKTPRSSKNVFDDLPAVRTESTDEELEKLRSGDYQEIRETRKKGERKPARVRFLAPISEGESLKSIKLTPRAPSTTNDENYKKTVTFETNESSEQGEDREKQESEPQERHISFFGIKFRRAASKNCTER